jgi:DNA-directed RNA polymerase subunit F
MLDYIFLDQEELQLLQQQKSRTDYFKKHGRWRTDKAKDGNVKENISERLSVTQNIGL